MELRRQKEAWAAAERVKREAWLVEKTAEVKEMTIKARLGRYLGACEQWQGGVTREGGGQALSAGRGYPVSCGNARCLPRSRMLRNSIVLTAGYG